MNTPDKPAPAPVDPVGATIASDPRRDVALAATVASDAMARSEDTEVIGPFGPFTIVERLAEQGAMGTVARGYHEGFDRWELLKFIRTDLMNQPELVRQFFREGRVLAKLSHPNVVQVFALYSHGGRPCLAMEFLEGQSLQALVAESGGKLPTAEWYELFLAAARGLAAAHDVGLLHRDIKPENLFVAKGRAGSPGGLKLIDFGLATGRRDRGDQDEGLIANNSGGTPIFMAPELWHGEEGSPRTDLYALGLTFFVALTGRLPFPTPQTLTEALAVVTSAEPFTDVRELRPELPAPLAAALRRTMAKAKDDRFSSADDLVAALVAAASAARPRRVPGSGPYRGLSSYGASERDVFYGRDAEIAEVLERLRWQTGIVLVGPSGCGKSSLARAGVLPSIEDGGLGGGIVYSPVVLEPHAHPCSSLAVALARKLGLAEKEVVEFLRARPASLGEALRTALPAEAGVVLLVDQLEELAIVAVNPSEVRDFAVALGSLLDVGSSPIRVVATLRADRMDGLFALEPLRPLLTRGFYPVRPLSGEALRRAVIEPAAAAGFQLENPDIADQIVKDVAQRAGGLPLLSFAMATWWEARDEATHMLPTAAWVELGGLAGSLTRHGDRVLAAMSDDERRAAERILVRLVSADRTSMPVARTSLVDPAAAGAGATRALDRLLETKLVQESAGEVELAHEALITQWPRLQSLLVSSGEDRAFHERVAAAARQWDAQRRPDGALWTGDQAMRLVRWFASSTAALDQQELAFVEAVRRREARARLVLRSVVAAVVLTALTVGFVAKGSERSMQRSLDAANAKLAASEKAYAHAESGRLQAKALHEVESDPGAATRNAAASYDLEHDTSLDVIAWAARMRGVGVMLPQLLGRVDQVAFGPGDGWIAAASGGDVTLLASHSAESHVIAAPADGKISALAFSDDGLQLALGMTSGHVAIAHTPAGKPDSAFDVRAVGQCTGAVRRLAWTSPSALLASCRDSAVTVDTAAGTSAPAVAPLDDVAHGPGDATLTVGSGVAHLKANGGSWSFDVGSPAFAWIAKRDAVALVGRTGEILIVSVGTGEVVGKMPNPGHEVTALGVDSGGGWLVAGARDGTLAAFDLEQTSVLLTRGLPGPDVPVCALSSDGASAACAAGGAVTVRVVADSAGAPGPPRTLALAKGQTVEGLAVTPSKAWLFTTSHGALSREGTLPGALMATADVLAASESTLGVGGVGADGKPTLALARTDLASPPAQIELPARVTSLAFGPDGAALFVATADRKIRQVDASSHAMKEVASLEGSIAEGDSVRVFSASDDGKSLAVGTRAGLVLLVPIAPAGAARRLVNLHAPVSCASVAHSGTAVVVAADRQASVLALDGGIPFSIWKTSAPITSCARGPFEDRFSFVDTDGASWVKAIDLTGVSESYVPPDPTARGALPTLAAWAGLPHGLGR